MLDHRLYTFIELCKTMNYRKAAERLNVTQPAVTQHIKYLEAAYGCKLFEYNGKTLSKTKECTILEVYVRSEIYNEGLLKESLKKPVKTPLNLGATKTIGDYVIPKALTKLSLNTEYELSVIVDNTQSLLKHLDNGQLDIAIIEGNFDKQLYDYQLYRKETFHGFCNKSHGFANQTVKVNDIWTENIILREQGSGTREIFEQLIKAINHRLDDFNACMTLNSFKLIETFIASDSGITFAYDAFAAENKAIVPFFLEGHQITREFNIVYLKNAAISHWLKDLNEALDLLT